jgi:hypothetical protein
MIEIPCNRNDLVLAGHYITQTKQRLVEQACRIRQLTTTGQDAIKAEETFRGMQKTFSILRAFREQLVFELVEQ